MTAARTLTSPIQLAFVVVTLAAFAASLLELPVQLRLPLVLGYLMIVPGYAFVRYLKLTDGFHVLMLSMASSVGVASASSVIALYASWWSPDGILIVIGVITVLAAYGELAVLHFQEEASAPDPSDFYQI